MNMETIHQEISAIKAKIIECEASISVLAVGSPGWVAVQQRLVELQKTLNILYVERRHLIDDKSKDDSKASSDLFVGYVSPPLTSYANTQEKVHTRVYRLRDINGSLTTLCQSRGFRNYVASQLTAIGVTGYIQRTAHRNARLVVRGTSSQVQLVDQFLTAITHQGMISVAFKEPPGTLTGMPVGEGFFVLRSESRYVSTGEHSDSKLDEVVSKSSADKEMLRGAPSPSSSKSDTKY